MKKKKAKAVVIDESVEHRQLIERLADAADEAGMWVVDFVKHAALLKKAKFSEDDLRPVIVRAAERLNRDRIDSILKRYAPRPESRDDNCLKDGQAQDQRARRPVTHAGQVTSHKEKNMVKVSMQAAAQLFEELGFEVAGQWTPKRMMVRIKSLPELVEGDDAAKPETRASKKTLSLLLKALKDSDEIELTQDEEDDEESKTKKPAKAEKPKRPTKKSEPEEEEDDEESDDEDDEDDEDEDEPTPARKKVAKGKGKVAKGKPAKAAKESKPAKSSKAKSKKPGATERDRFGSRVDTGCAKINACFGKRGVTVAQIAESTGLKDSFIRSHVRTLTTKGHIKQTDKGLVLA